MNLSLEQYLKKNPKTHLIFDLDETLAHLILPWNDYMDKIKDILIKTDKTIYENYISRKINLSELQNLYVKKCGDKFKEIFQKNSLDFETHYLKKVKVNQPLINFIAKDKNHKMFIWSSNTTPVIKRVLEENKIYNKFEKIITRLDVKMIKPFDDGFKKIYDPKIPKNNYLFIGDKKVDLLASQNAGIDFFQEKYFVVK